MILAACACATLTPVTSYSTLRRPALCAISRPSTAAICKAPHRLEDPAGGSMLRLCDLALATASAAFMGEIRPRLDWESHLATELLSTRVEIDASSTNSGSLDRLDLEVGQTHVVAPFRDSSCCGVPSLPAAWALVNNVGALDVVVRRPTRLCRRADDFAFASHDRRLTARASRRDPICASGSTALKRFAQTQS